MIAERWVGALMRCLVLGSMIGDGACASVEYRVPSWEVERLTHVPPAARGAEVRVVPTGVVVPPPPVAGTQPSPPSEVDVPADVPVEVPVVVGAPPPVVVAPRRVVTPRRVGAPVVVNQRPAPPAQGGWRVASTNAGGWRGSAAVARPNATHLRSSGGGRHGGGGGGAAGAAAGAVAAVALIAILADAAATEAAADAARRFDGWVAVDAGHPLRLYYYGGNLCRIVPLARLTPADLIGLQYAALEEDDGHVEPLGHAPPPPA
ncbi:MAG TPA: hypothetical protein VGP64_15530, partial [Polyangia bacterium]